MERLGSGDCFRINIRLSEVDGFIKAKRSLDIERHLDLEGLLDA